jgi:hypothetical protein
MAVVQGDFAFELGVGGTIDLAHTTLAEQFSDFVMG